MLVSNYIYISISFLCNYLTYFQNMLSAESSMNTISISGPRAKNTEEAWKDTYCKLLCILLLCVRLLPGYLNLTIGLTIHGMRLLKCFSTIWYTSKVDYLVISCHYPLPMKSNSNFKQISSLCAACYPTLLYSGMGSGEYQLNIVKIIK